MSILVEVLGPAPYIFVEIVSKGQFTSLAELVVVVHLIFASVISFFIESQ